MRLGIGHIEPSIMDTKTTRLQKWQSLGAKEDVTRDAEALVSGVFFQSHLGSDRSVTWSQVLYSQATRRIMPVAGVEITGQTNKNCYVGSRKLIKLPKQNRTSNFDNFAQETLTLRIPAAHLLLLRHINGSVATDAPGPRQLSQLLAPAQATEHHGGRGSRGRRQGPAAQTVVVELRDIET